MAERLKTIDSTWRSRAGHPATLAQALSALLYRYDPIQIAYHTNEDEYEPEAARILIRLENCQSPVDACGVVYEELVRSFGVEAVGTAEEYRQLAQEAWVLCQDLTRPG